MASPIAVRKTMHGPLWEVEGARFSIQLWAPSFDRGHWAFAWIETDRNRADEDAEITDQGYERAATLGAIPALVPRCLVRERGAAFGALIAAAQLWRPDEPCDHTRATSYGERDVGRVCGYCGRLYQPKETAA